MLSTGHCKRCNHPPLIEIENKFTGAKIGYIRVPHVTVADDVVLLTNLASEMQVMLPCTGSYANIARFVSHPTKSCILIHTASVFFIYFEWLREGQSRPRQASWYP